MKIPMPIEWNRCDSFSHWEDMLIWGHCLKCNHMISEIEKRQENFWDNVDKAYQEVKDNN